MPNIFEYTDYRKYLAGWFEEKKKSLPSFSYASFAQKAGFSDRGFFHNVIHGKRDLTKESIVKVSQAIGHSKTEADYFENLVFFNKASELKERSYFFEKINSVKSTGRTAVKAMEIRKDQYDFYSKWYHSAIRSLIDMYPFKDDYQWLAKNVFPQITSRQAKKSVQLLERLGLIARQKDKTYKLASKSVTTGNEVVSLAVNNFHKESADLAKNALECLPVNKRNITGLTLGISEKSYFKICEEIQAFRAKIIQSVQQDDESDRTYQLNFHFFPITNTAIKVRGIYEKK
jgi:uncharacterized protein (TIGR02147 family)